jgi:hypothetical protein
MSDQSAQRARPNGAAVALAEPECREGNRSTWRRRAAQAPAGKAGIVGLLLPAVSRHVWPSPVCELS